MVRLLCRVLVTLLVISAISVSLEARQTKGGTASISGRVTVAGKPAGGVALTLKGSTRNEQRAIQMLLEGGLLEKTSTDEEGRYRFDGVAAGRYEIVPYAPSLIPADDKSVTVTLADGERVDDIDFVLSKGGAITGRVTGADGRPLIMESVRVARVDKTTPNAAAAFDGSLFSTDDRGIYRVYGLRPGHYKVSIGKAEWRLELAGLLFNRPNHPPTFHPGVTDETKAAIVEVAAGGETANIDIKVGVAKKTYIATGRVIEAATGRPFPNAIISYMVVDGDGSSTPGMTGLGSPSSATGEFRLEGLTTGRYRVFALFGFERASDYYSEMQTFEIKQEDLMGLELKVQRGGSISGVVVVEGATDPAVLERMTRTEIFAMVMGEDGAPNFARSRIAEDGSFQLRGLKSGKIRVMIQDFLSQSGLTIVRVERQGVPQPAGIDLAAGEHLTDVRLVLAHASGAIRGQVNVEGGTLPKESEIQVVVSRKTTDGNPTDALDDSEEADIDAAGRFVLGDLIPGEYDVLVRVVLNPTAPANQRQVRQAREQVTVTGGNTAEVVVVLDLSKRSEKN